MNVTYENLCTYIELEPTGIHKETGDEIVMISHDDGGVVCEDDNGVVCYDHDELKYGEDIQKQILSYYRDDINKELSNMLFDLKENHNDIYYDMINDSNNQKIADIIHKVIVLNE